jgi:hypothetical protein
MTVDVDYAAWAEIRERYIANGYTGRPPSAAACRDNIRGLAEEALATALDDYVPYEFVD